MHAIEKPARVSRRVQAMLDSRAREKNKEGRMERLYVIGDEFMHELLAAEFEASGKRMIKLMAAVTAEAQIYHGPCPAGGTYRKRRDVAFSKFKEMQRREALFTPLLKRSEKSSPDLTQDEWKSLRSEMHWLNEVRNSYDGWDWKVDGTQR